MASDIDTICVLSNKTILEWELRAIENVVENTDAEVSMVVINDEPDIDQDDSVISTWDSDTVSETDGERSFLDTFRLFVHLLQVEGGWAFVLAERKIGRAIAGIDRPMMENHDVEEVDCFSSAERVYSEPIPSRGGSIPGPSVGGVWKRLPDDVVDRIVDECDLVVRFGFGLIEGRILSELEHGVLSFHSSDIKKYRGLASTERFLAGDSEAGATLQRLNDEIDAGQIVAMDTTDVSDEYTLDTINEKVKKLQTEMLLDGVRNLQDPDFEPSSPDSLAGYTSTKKKMEYGYCAKVAVKDTLGWVRTILYN